MDSGTHITALEPGMDTFVAHTLQATSSPSPLSIPGKLTNSFCVAISLTPFNREVKLDKLVDNCEPVKPDLCLLIAFDTLEGKVGFAGDG